MRRALLYFNTIKYLKFKQIYYRLFYLLYSAIVDLSIQKNTLRNATTVKHSFILKNKLFFQNNTATFLNNTADISGKNSWNDTSRTGLWLYQLHYFDALLSENLQQRDTARELLERWIDENPPFFGIGWEPFPISLRIVNIIKYALSGNALTEKMRNSLYLQARYLNKKCEYHLLGNHLFENFKALCLSGLFFETPESQTWFQKGFRGLQQEIQTQVLKDGGHFELSPMYHCLFLEGLLDLENIFGVYNKIFPWKEKVISMLSWLNSMKRSLREISYFNDAANDIAATPEQLFLYATALGYSAQPEKKGLKYLSESGYIVIQNTHFKIILDVGNIGPDYLPGHGHADTLSFELMIDEIPVFVNLGTSVYGNSDRRLFERGTSAHNTVAVNQKNSSEVWSGFRAGRRARVSNIHIAENKNFYRISASHHGYTGNLKHIRQWTISENQIEIIDEIQRAREPSYFYLHLHPACKIISIDEKQVIVQLINGKLIHISIDHHFNIIKSDYAESFGFLRSTQTIRVPFSNRNVCRFEI